MSDFTLAKDNQGIATITWDAAGKVDERDEHPRLHRSMEAHRRRRARRRGGERHHHHLWQRGQLCGRYGPECARQDERRTRAKSLPKVCLTAS